MCTVVCSWQPSEPLPVLMLALRDELRSRDFDLPGRWWPELPTVVGGRDRRAGGSWCVTDVDRGRTAVVLNRPERREAAPGGASRGVLPLVAVRHGDRWPDFVNVAAMAGFNLVLAGPEAAAWWSFDGTDLRGETLNPGITIFNPSGRSRDFPDSRLGQRPLIGDVTYPGRRADAAWDPWLSAVQDSRPSLDRTGLLVQRPYGDDRYETVFGQFIASAPGALRVDHLSAVAQDPTAPWTTTFWAANGAGRPAY